MIAFRSCDRRFPFRWAVPGQPPGRWNAAGAGPVQYLADTPDGAWAEFLRHEEIVDKDDLSGVARALWAVEVDEPGLDQPRLPDAVMTGGLDTYPTCQREAARLRGQGSRGIAAPSAALQPGGAHGFQVAGGRVRPGPARSGITCAVFGPRPDAVGWAVVERGHPPGYVLGTVRHLSG